MGELSDNEQDEAVKGILKSEAEIKFRAAATATAVVHFYRERPLWRIAAVGLIVFPPIIGYSIVGHWGILFGLAVGIIADIIAPLGRILVIERRRG